MLVLCAGALAQARARAQGSCAPPPARGQQPHLRRTAGPDAAHAHRRFRAAGPRASFVTPVCKNLQGCRGHWLARAARAQGCRARALACARARAQGGTHVGGTRAPLCQLIDSVVQIQANSWIDCRSNSSANRFFGCTRCGNCFAPSQIWFNEIGTNLHVFSGGRYQNMNRLTRWCQFALFFFFNTPFFCVKPRCLGMIK